MKCPKCQGSTLKIKPAAGFEFLLLLFISKRKYTCASCGHAYRAPDRREFKRESAAGDSAGTCSLPTR